MTRLRFFYVSPKIFFIQLEKIAVKIPAGSVMRFFEMVSAAALANPFGEERDGLDQAIIKEWLAKTPANRTEVEKIAELTGSLLEDFYPATGPVRVESEKTKLILGDAALFYLFHKYMNAFDEYIQMQNSTVGVILELPFAEKIEGDLKRYGFRDSAAHYIAVFFQMRRAFFFINKFVGGNSAPVRKLREQLWRTIFSSDLRQYIDVLFDKMESFTVLLLGETGVGKGQAAAALGRSAYIPFDPKSRKFVVSFLDVFISANISEYPETLVESELFGHKKGAFTGALDNHAGLFGQTHHNGVLFLDEIGELIQPLQVKILRVLQERNYSPVGGHDKKRFNGRLIAATNANLMEKVSYGEFRADLYHRLASDVITIPSLRERFSADKREFSEILSRILMRLLGTVDGQADVFSVLGKVVPKNYPWPGNLREFEQVVRRVILHGENLQGLNLHSGGVEGRRSDAGRALNWQSLRWTAEEVMVRYAKSAYEVLGSYEKVAQKLDVDWRTAKRWIAGEVQVRQGESADLV
ncbi:MAG: hypothetical protein RLZZ488_1690 [Pseudomonadota bacterium]|jgi:transcriptional regulator with AAA-type ATPase domain